MINGQFGSGVGLPHRAVAAAKTKPSPQRLSFFRAHGSLSPAIGRIFREHGGKFAVNSLSLATGIR